MADDLLGHIRLGKDAKRYIPVCIGQFQLIHFGGEAARQLVGVLLLGE